LVKGVLVCLSEDFLGPVPNIIVFQYNPETITRTLQPFTGAASEGEADKDGGGVSTSQPFDPQEEFKLTLEFDATDELEKPYLNPGAAVFGVADRVAALEMLLYPTGQNTLSQAISSALGSATPVPKGRVPIILFAWGPGRIVPVRLTEFSVKEEAYSTTLYPVRATVNVGMRVLTAQALKEMGRTLSATEELAVKAYQFTKKQKELLAAKNMVSNVASLDLLPL
jgi:hypothetical protein